MRYGFTTGSCAAAAAKAAAYMLLTGNIKENISIITPKGITFDAKIEDIVRREQYVECAVIKDGGDDPDVTSGAHIVVRVEYGGEGIDIEGGKGVGRVTLPGLDQPQGNAAINRVPREMIAKEVKEVCDVCDYSGGLKVSVSVPEGEELASKTFNPRLGIEGGISILGTSGIVEPMSSKALIDTIRVELNQKKALGHEFIAVSPGNYGQDFMKNAYDYDLDKSVKCSNFIGETIDMVKEAGFKGMLLTGHIGKLVKVSGGIMNTHSKEADGRMELMAAAALRAGADRDLCLRILESISTEYAVDILKEADILEDTMDRLMEKIMYYLRIRAGEDLKIECMVYSNAHGLLAKSEQAEEMLESCKKRGE